MQNKKLQLIGKAALSTHVRSQWLLKRGDSITKCLTDMGDHLIIYVFYTHLNVGKITFSLTSANKV